MYPTDNAADYEKLIARAEAVAKALQANQEHAPVAIEFAGSPKSGKSTTIDILVHFFKRTGFKVWAPTEGASKRTPYHLKRDLVAFNAWTLNYAISEILVAYYNVDRHHLIVLDRGPFDSLAWMLWLQQRGDLNQDDYSIMKRFALFPKWNDLISRVYLFTCSPQVSLSRENQMKLISKDGVAMNVSCLSSLLSIYEDVKRDVRQDQIVPIDTSSEGNTAKQNAGTIAEDILEIFEDAIKA